MSGSSSRRSREPGARIQEVGGEPPAADLRPWRAVGPGMRWGEDLGAPRMCHFD